MITFMNVVWTLIQYLGGLVVAVGAVGAFAAWLVKRWIQKGLDKDLETHKADLQRVNAAEVERLKVELTAELGRRSKLLEREFEALPEVWDKVQTALGAVQVVASAFRRGTSVYGLNEEELEDALSRLDIPEHCKREVREAPDRGPGGDRLDPTRQEVFAKYEHGVRLSRALETVHDARNFLIGQGIFISREINRRLMELLNLARRAVDEEVMHHQHPPVPGMRIARADCEAFMRDADGLIREVEALIRDRFGTAD